MSQPKLWRRKFNREKYADLDVVAEDSYRAEYFTDFFGGIWLPSRLGALTFDSVLKSFWDDHRAKPSKNSFAAFCVADGGMIPVTDEQSAWLHQNIRFVVFVAGGPKGPEEPFQDKYDGSWTLCIVGSAAVHSERAFLQVASWDGKVFRYYGRDGIQSEGWNPRKPVPGWVYQGVSTDAFKDELAYLGPFNGHVNGSLVMKELHQPWLHWSTSTNNPTGNFPPKILNMLDEKTTPYFTDGDDTLSRIGDAEQMEIYIISGIGKWFDFRGKMDFTDSKGQPLSNLKGLKRWMAHLLLTTTVNIGAALTAETEDTWVLPPSHVYSKEMTSSIQPYRTGDPTPKIWETEDLYKPLHFAMDVYRNARDQDLQLHLVQDVDPAHLPAGYCHVMLPAGALGGGKPGTAPVDVVIVESDEGATGTFTTIEPSHEDATGVETFMSQKIPILSPKAYNALTMVDAWNPVYSWRRGVLLQYVPDGATLNADKQSYTLEREFVEAVRASPQNKDGSPEREFLDNYEKTELQAAFPDRLKSYFNAVQAQANTQQGMADLLSLAESRRRIYRPVPLDEFALTLPWALKWPHRVPLEMQENGTTKTMDDRGVAFLKNWIGTLQGNDPQLLPKPDATVSDKKSKPTAAVGEEMAVVNALAISCQSSTTMATPRSGGCPMFSLKKYRGDPAITDGEGRPTWDDDILEFFTAPSWVSEDVLERRGVAAGWKKAMLKFGAGMPDGTNLTLDKYEHVKLQAVTIYQHCSSRSMPITSDPKQYWPTGALETMRLWINQGCRKSKDEPIMSHELIPKEINPSPVWRVRKDVRDLTPEEVRRFRSKLQDVLQVDAMPSKWQDLGELHAWWCLHYQEATFLWHRCWLRYVEDLIDFPIPYWNGFATDAADPKSPFAGLPQIFLDETYIHPDGSTRKNPLKYAFAYQKKSKVGTSEYVQRDPLLVQGRPSHPGKAMDEWNARMALLTKYHKQILNAMTYKNFSTPQGMGVAWENIPAFLPDTPDKYYACQNSFDGWFEQAHDNFHGWVGGDMADNTYTAFDPIFLAYHCNMDRLVEHYLRSRPNTQYSSNFPLRPFVNNATGVDYTNPNPWAYTTLGDMAKDTQANGYIYAPPACPDNWPTPQLQKSKVPAPRSNGGDPFTMVAQPMDLKLVAESDMTMTPHILFRDVVCTKSSYTIDLFLKDAKSLSADPVTNPDFIGRLFRFGMSEPPDRPMKNKSRCHKNAVTRIVEVEEHIDADTLERRGWMQVVKELTPGVDKGWRDIPQTEWANMKGFTGELIFVGEAPSR